MSSTTWLTTADAEELYGFPAKIFASWCREDKIAGAQKDGGEWLMPQDGVTTFLGYNPQLKPPNRNSIAQIPELLWKTMAVVALILGLAADVYAVRDIVQGGDRTLLWIIAGALSVGLFVSALIILTSKRRQGIVRLEGDKPVYREIRRFRSSLARRLSWIAVIAMPTFLILGIVGYNLWRVVPPRKTVVLVADFRTPDGQDPQDVTEKIVKGMRHTLTGYPKISIKRLNRPISEEQGSETARAMGNRPEYKATYVIWGDYVLVPEPELYVHFEVLRQTESYFGTGIYEQYGPGQIQQPSMFDFKLELGPYLGQLIAFASGVTLYDAGNYREAVSLFDTAAQAIGQRFAVKWERAIRFYRGSNFLALDRARDAKPDLAALIPGQDSPIQVFDGMAVAALSNLGLVAVYQGDFETAKGYLEQALAVAQQRGIPEGEAMALGNLGIVARYQGDYETAKSYHQQALAIDRQLGYPHGEAVDLSNLGTVALHQSDYGAAKSYHEQALAKFRQLGNPLGEAYNLIGLGRVVDDQGHYETAKGYYEEALAVYRQQGDSLGEAVALGNLGIVARYQGDYETAKSYLEQSLAIDRQLGYPQGEAVVLRSLGVLAQTQGDHEAAKSYLEQALAIDRRLGDPLGEGADLNNLGIVARYQGDYETAKSYHEQALAIDRRLGNPLGEAADLSNLGVLAQNQGDFETAKGYLEQALAIAQQRGIPEGEARVLGNLGLVAQQQGDNAAAKSYLEQSARLYQQLGLPVASAVQSALDNLSAQ